MKRPDPVVEFLAFRVMLSRWVLMVLWWLIALSGALAAVIGPFLINQPVLVPIGLLTILVSRLVIELLLVQFAIHQALVDVRAELRQRAS